MALDEKTWSETAQLARHYNGLARSYVLLADGFPMLEESEQDRENRQKAEDFSARAHDALQPVHTYIETMFNRLPGAFFTAASPRGEAVKEKNDPYMIEYALQFARNLEAFEDTIIENEREAGAQDARIYPFFSLEKLRQG